eukprot:7294771-Alexandrium_andersonii.AAC.1
MATSSGPAATMSSTQTRSHIANVKPKKRRASVLQRAKPSLTRKSAECFCHGAGAERSPHVAFLSFHAFVPSAMPIFFEDSGGGHT